MGQESVLYEHGGNVPDRDEESGDKERSVGHDDADSYRSDELT